MRKFLPLLLLFGAVIQPFMAMASSVDEKINAVMESFSSKSRLGAYPFLLC